jgi:hypothetical protein
MFVGLSVAGEKLAVVAGERLVLATSDIRSGNLLC